MPYYASAGPERGTIMWRDNYGALGVHDRPEFGARSLVGIAMGGGPGPGGVDLFKLTVHGQELPGLWMVVDGEFRPAQ